MKDIPLKVRYNNHTFYLQQSGRYYSRSAKRKGDEALLHRQVYADNFGPIPEGMVVHHVDGDWQNNNPKNLQLKDNGQHHREHALEWHAANRERSLANIAAIRPMAAAWHSTDEGRKWHSEHATRALIERPQRSYVCEECGASFTSNSINFPRFCRNQCRWKSNGRARVARRNAPK